jgi:uncharacterized protein GlcG (DUF336 family)
MKGLRNGWLAVWLLSLSGAATAVQAQPAKPPTLLPTARQMSVDFAVEAATQAERACAAKGYVVSAAVVDPAGALRALVAGDGASSLKTEASRRKAYTAAIFAQPTATVAAAMPDAAQVLGPLDRNLLFAAGGLPIRVSGDLIGAIGVAGAPGGDKDEACAQAGIARAAADFR